MSRRNCRECSLEDIAKHPDRCYYQAIKGYRYWELLQPHLERYRGNVRMEGCPFRRGMNQLWRNQVLAFALENTKVYHRVTFSVCHHAKNSMLHNSINKYKALIDNDNIFSSFTNYDIIDAINDDHHDLHTWKRWYWEVYCF